MRGDSLEVHGRVPSHRYQQNLWPLPHGLRQPGPCRATPWFLLPLSSVMWLVFSEVCKCRKGRLPWWRYPRQHALSPIDSRGSITTLHEEPGNWWRSVIKMQTGAKWAESDQIKNDRRGWFGLKTCQGHLQSQVEAVPAGMALCFKNTPKICILHLS